MIELTVYGDPAACRAAAEAGLRVVKAVEEDASVLGRSTCDSWTGGAGERYRSTVRSAVRAMRDIADRIGPACRAVEDLAGELEVVERRMERVRSIATAAGLHVSGDVVHPPTEADDMPPSQVSAHNARVAVYDRAFEDAQEARTKEREAHSRVVSAMRASNGDGLIENLLERLGLATPDGMDVVTGAGYGLGLAGLGLSALSNWIANVRVGMWQPRFRNANGKWVWGTNKGWSAAGRLKLSLRPGSMFKDRDFKARPGQSATRGRWLSAAKWANRAGGVVTGLTAGWSQWQADADDPSLDSGERVDRTATSAVATGAGAWGGAYVGASIGGAIGTAIFPGAGTVVGGAIGGVVGGAVGAYAGSELSEIVNEQWDGAVHAASDGLSAAGDAIGDGLSATGDALSDAGDAIGDGLSAAGDSLTFWD